MKSSHIHTANAVFVIGCPLLAHAFECLWLVFTFFSWWRPNLKPVELMHFWFPFFFFFFLDEKNEFIKKKLKVY
jgi:predicted MPP superfamily phosphohydrolase